MPIHEPLISVRAANASDRPTVECLWLMFRHDMSEFGGQLPNPDGTFRTERLVAAFDDQDWACYVFTGPEDGPAGFAIVRGLAGPVRVINSFFVVRAISARFFTAWVPARRLASCQTTQR